MSAVLQLPNLRDLAKRGVFRAPQARGAPAGWGRDEIAGRLVELSGRGSTATLTFTLLVVLDCQRQGELAAWITATEPFFPPDVEAMGVDLAALPVIRAGDAGRGGRAADALLRSGAFGLVVLDLGPDRALPMPLQARLTQLARTHGTALVCLTEKAAGQDSLSSLVSLRAEVQRTYVGPDRFRCELRALKDKHRGPGWTHVEVCHGPPGLR